MCANVLRLGEGGAWPTKLPNTA